MEITLSRGCLILDGNAGGVGKSTISLIIQELVGLNVTLQSYAQGTSQRRFELYRYLKKTFADSVLDTPW